MLSFDPNIIILSLSLCYVSVLLVYILQMASPHACSLHLWLESLPCFFRANCFLRAQSKQRQLRDLESLAKMSANPCSHPRPSIRIQSHSHSNSDPGAVPHALYS